MGFLQIDGKGSPLSSGMQTARHVPSERISNVYKGEGPVCFKKGAVNLAYKLPKRIPEHDSDKFSEGYYRHIIMSKAQSPHSCLQRAFLLNILLVTNFDIRYIARVPCNVSCYVALSTSVSL